jgi:hypothetical protein
MTDLIPNVYHFVFGLRPQTEPFHLMHYLCLASCLAVAKPDAIHFHYRNEPFGPLWDRIKPALVLRRVEPVDFVSNYAYTDPRIAAFSYAHAADFLRLEILVAEGGFYADMDTLFVRPPPTAWADRHCILGRETPPPEARGAGALCNAWIGARKGSAFLELWLGLMQEAFDGSWSSHSTLLPHRLAQLHPDLVHVEPQAAFFALDWTRAGLTDLFLRDVPLPDDAYSLHLWSHLWFDAKRHDFIDFHHGLLTEDYLAFARTTYARLARPFLPAGARPSRARFLAQRARLLAHAPRGHLAAWIRRRK